MRKSRYLAASRIVTPLLIVMLGSGTARADVISTFDIDAEDWTVVSFSDLSADDYSLFGTYTPTYVASGGNPAGYIFLVDPDEGQFTFAAPAAFLGNQSDALSLSYDLIHPTGAVNFQTTDVMLVGGGTRLLWRSAPALVPSATSWSHVDVALSPSSSWLVGSTTGLTAQPLDFQTVLADLTGIFVRGEYTSGDDSAGLDNFHLVPEPSSLVLFGLGSFGLLGIGRKQRRRAVAK